MNRTKHFISGADHAYFFIVFVVTGEDDTAGFTIRDGNRSVSHRGYKNMIPEFDD